MGLHWNDSREIAEELYDNHPTVHPLSVLFTDLHDWIVNLPNFDDNPEISTEKHLEAIQMIWYQEWKMDNADAPDPYNFQKK